MGVEIKSEADGAARPNFTALLATHAGQHSRCLHDLRLYWNMGVGELQSEWMHNMGDYRLPMQNVLKMSQSLK